uniref:Uncharacterized protein n=1 Tax=Percolomonas cosmopolitus TaxID=63605 RepID=A0A7S1PFX7_9EUKA
MLSSSPTPFDPKRKRTSQKSKRKGLKGTRLSGNTQKYSRLDAVDVRFAGIPTMPNLYEYQVNEQNSSMSKRSVFKVLENHRNDEQGIASYSEFCSMRSAVEKHSDAHGKMEEKCIDEHAQKHPYKPMSKRKMKKIFYQNKEISRNYQLFKEKFPDDECILYAKCGDRRRTPFFESGHGPYHMEKVNHQRKRREWRSTSLDSLIL